MLIEALFKSVGFVFAVYWSLVIIRAIEAWGDKAWTVALLP